MNSIPSFLQPVVITHLETLLRWLSDEAYKRLLPRAAQHQHAARVGFSDDAIWQQADRVVEAARKALDDDPDAVRLAPLEQILAMRETQADSMVRVSRATGSIDAVLALTTPSAT